MRRSRLIEASLASLVAFTLTSGWVIGQTVSGGSLALHSSGAAAGSGWTLSTNGYVGTYVQLSQPTALTLTANASGAAAGGLSPQMTFAIADTKQSFSVNSSSLTNYTYTPPTMPAGTYFIRT